MNRPHPPQTTLRRAAVWIAPALAGLSLGLLVPAVRKGRDGRAFLLSSSAFLCLWATVGALLHPNLVRASDPALSLTCAQRNGCNHQKHCQYPENQFAKM